MNLIFNELLERYPCLEVCKNEIYSVYEAMVETYENSGKILCCGNGGSAADCDHLVGELMKGFLKQRPLSAKEKDAFDDSFVADNLQKGLPAVSLTAHSALMTAYSNDAVSQLVFAQQVYAFGNKSDLLFAFSTSGNSENVIYAVEAAKVKGVFTVAVTGRKESKLSEISDICIRLPETETFKIQEFTLPVYHCLAAMVEDKFFEN